MNQISAELSNQFLETLDDLVRMYRGLLETVRREKEILISSQLDDLNENNRAKEALIAKVRYLEENRIEQASQISRELGLNPDSPRLLEIARHVSDELGDRLRNIHSVLEILIKRVQELNRENEILVQAALQTVTGAMKSIKETLQPAQTYQRKGEVAATSTSTGHLVSREA